MSRPPRWAAAAGAALALTVAGAAQTVAAPRSTAFNSAPQRVSAGSAAVVIQAGTSPATVPGAGWVVPGNLGTQYGVLTNIGTLPPQTATVAVTGVNLSTISACTVPWTAAGCSGTSAYLNAGLPIAGGLLPGGKTWYLKMDGLNLVTTFTVTNTSPAVSVTKTNS